MMQCGESVVLGGMFSCIAKELLHKLQHEEFPLIRQEFVENLQIFLQKLCKTSKYKFMDGQV
jgi:hypothetical protein